MSVHLFTSITCNYLPKARVLAWSVKRQYPTVHFHLVLCDYLPKPLIMEDEPFNSIITIEELPIPNIKGWIFKHSVVEMCTAVKGIAFLEIARRYNGEKIFYFDPDTVVFSGLNELTRRLDQHSILLTPHLTIPEKSLETIIENEICSLRHGVFNLGFLGVRTTDEGMRFLNWWSERLIDFCYDDIMNGLFTDQRWIDLVPAFFDDIGILREPIYNVATWNLTYRIAGGSVERGITINGQPLSFYHFSGFDSGAQEVMLKKYGQTSSVLFDLRKWYIAECERMGQEEFGSIRCGYDFFENGEIINKGQRLIYRSRIDLQQAFPNPFMTSDLERSYYHWCKENIEESIPQVKNESEDILRVKLMDAYRELELIKHSRSWRLARMISKAFHVFK